MDKQLENTMLGYMPYLLLPNNCAGQEFSVGTQKYKPTKRGLRLKMKEMLR